MLAVVLSSEQGLVEEDGQVIWAALAACGVATRQEEDRPQQVELKFLLECLEVTVVAMVVRVRQVLPLTN
jgi:hypothetical protein